MILIMFDTLINAKSALSYFALSKYKTCIQIDEHNLGLSLKEFPKH